jgi:transposase
MQRYVGLDAHSKNSVYVIQDAEGQVVGRGTVPTTADGFKDMRDRLELRSGTPVALESGAVAFVVADYLNDLGLRPIVVDAREVRVKASRPRQKSDFRDARELCEGVRRGMYRAIVSVPPREIRTLRETLSRRRHFVRVRTAQVNAAKWLLRSNGKGALARSLQLESGWNTLIAALSDAPALQAFVRQHQAVWRCAGEQVTLLDLEIRRLGRTWKKELTLLETAPGVGTIVGSTALAVLFDPHRFPSAKHAASYAGLVPTTDQSGDREHYGHITKRGSSELRAMLCEAAQHARRTNHPLHPYFAKVWVRRGYRMAVVAVAHRLCRILFAMLRDGTPFRPDNAGIERSVPTYRLRRA